MMMRAPIIYHRYCAHTDRGRFLIILSGGSRASLMPHRFKTGQSNIGTPSVRISQGNDSGATPLRISCAHWPARRAKAATSTADPPTAPEPNSVLVMIYTGALADSAINFTAWVELTAWPAPSR